MVFYSCIFVNSRTLLANSFMEPQDWDGKGELLGLGGRTCGPPCTPAQGPPPIHTCAHSHQRKSYKALDSTGWSWKALPCGKAPLHGESLGSLRVPVTRKHSVGSVEPRTGPPRDGAITYRQTGRKDKMGWSVHGSVPLSHLLSGLHKHLSLTCQEET